MREAAATCRSPTTSRTAPFIHCDVLLQGKRPSLVALSQGKRSSIESAARRAGAVAHRIQHVDIGCRRFGDTTERVVNQDVLVLEEPGANDQAEWDPRATKFAAITSSTANTTITPKATLVRDGSDEG